MLDGGQNHGRPAYNLACTSDLGDKACEPDQGKRRTRVVHQEVDARAAKRSVGCHGRLVQLRERRRQVQRQHLHLCGAACALLALRLHALQGAKGRGEMRTVCAFPPLVLLQALPPLMAAMGILGLTTGVVIAWTPCEEGALLK